MTNDVRLKPRILAINGVPMTTSLAIAEHFEKEHRNVLRAIREEVAQQADAAFTDRHFMPTEHVDAKGEPRLAYKLTEVGFSLIAMGFTGARAARWKRAYVEVFEAMRETLQKRQAQILEDTRKHFDFLERRCRNLEASRATAEANAARAYAELQGLEQEARKLRVEKYVADQILSEGALIDEPARLILELKESLGELINKQHLQKQAFEKRELQLRAEAERAGYEAGWPDPRRIAAHETLVRLLYAVDGVFSDACLIWALLQLRATTELIRASCGSRGPAVSGAHSVTLREVEEVLGRGVSRRALRAASLRLISRGLAQLVRGKPPLSAMHLQLNLQELLKLLSQTRESAEWVGANVDTSLEANHEGVHLLLPMPGEMLPPDALLQSRTRAPYPPPAPLPVELRIVVVGPGEEPEPPPQKQTLH